MLLPGPAKSSRDLRLALQDAGAGWMMQPRALLQTWQPLSSKIPRNQPLNLPPSPKSPWKSQGQSKGKMK
eukprot:6384479-Lingulodinium_polyedra.AAC.1